MRISPKALTLIELMITVVLLLVVISGSLVTYISCIMLIDTSHNLTVAVNDAQTVLEQVKSLAYSQITSYVPPVFNNLGSENITLNNSVGVHMATISVTVNWVERSRARALTLKTYVAK